MLRRVLLFVVLAASFAIAQSSAPAPQSASDAPSAQTSPAQAGTQQDDSEQSPKPSKNPIKRIKDQVSSPWCVHVGGAQKCLNDTPQSNPVPDQRGSKSSDTDQQAGPGPNQPTPRSDDRNRSLQQDGESSSRETMIDLRPPKNDAIDHPESSSVEDSDVQEMHKWDPHKAMKNVEVGDYYFKRENYRAAESRYLEALDWKDNDAEAMYKLGITEEKLGNAAEARKYFEQYLRTLPGGEFAAEAQTALTRLDAPATAQQKPAGTPQK